MRLADERFGVLDHGLRIVPAPMADNARIATVHDPRLIAAVERAGTTPGVLDEEFGLGTDDNPTFRDMHQPRPPTWSARAWRPSYRSGAVRACGASTSPAACTTRWATGPAVSVSTTTRRSAIAVPPRPGCQRVAYVDVDVHHGDGVGAIFWDYLLGAHDQPARDPAETLFPGSGFPHDVRRRGVPGSAVNVALPPGTDDGGWLRAFHAVVPAACGASSAPRCWSPSVRRRTYRLDPLARPEPERGRAARDVPGAAGPRPRGGWRPLGGDRRRRLRAGRGRTPGRDRPPRRRRTCSTPRPTLPRAGGPTCGRRWGAPRRTA